MPRRTDPDPRRMTLPRAGLTAVLLGIGMLGVGTAAGAAPAQDDDPGYVSVIEVSGLLDRVLVDFVETQIAEAEEGDARALVLQMNSPGVVVADDRLDDLVDRIEGSTVPVDV